MRHPIAAALALTVLVLGGCGGDDETSTSTTADPNAVPGVGEARACLSEAGFEVEGAVSSPVDENSPEAEVIFTDGTHQGFVAFYSDSEAAEGAEATIRTNIEISNGVVERQGAVTVYWTTPPGRESGEAAAECAFGSG